MKTKSKVKKQTPKKFYVLIRDNEWYGSHETIEEAREHAKDEDTILEISGSWEVSSKLNFRKEGVDEYI